MTKRSRTEDSKREQDRVDSVAESEVTDIYENVHDRYDDLPDGNRESIEGERRVRAEGGIRHEGEDGQEEVCDAENSAHDLINDHNCLVHLPEAHNGTREEQEDGGVEEGWEESDEGPNVPPLEHHEANVPLASSMEVDNWVEAAIVLCEPFFEDRGTETGAETGGEASEPEAVDRDRGTGGLEGEGWVGYGRQVWIATVQQLVKEQRCLFFVIWFQVVEGRDEEGCDDGREQGGLQTVLV